MVWLRMIHLFALGLWVGASAFFSFFTALPIINRMKELAVKPGNWLGLTDEKQGIRVAGEALDGVFDRYFVFQVICGVIGLATAAFWFTTPGLVNKARFAFVALGLGLATLNLVVLAPQVHSARLHRYDANAEVAKSADAAFGRLHTYSLACDLTTLACAAVALALAAWLPGEGLPKP